MPSQPLFKKFIAVGIKRTGTMACSPKCLKGTSWFGSPYRHLNSTGCKWYCLNQAVFLWSDVGLAAGLEGVEIVRSRSAGIKSRNRTQSHVLDEVGVVIQVAYTATLHAVYPERRAPVVCARRGRRPPFNLNHMRSVADRDPCRAGCTSAVEHWSQSDLMTRGGGETQL